MSLLLSGTARCRRRRLARQTTDRSFLRNICLARRAGHGANPDLNAYFESLKSMKSAPKYQILINDNNLMNTGVEKPADLTGTIDFTELINSGEINSTILNDLRIDSADLAMIQFTSGTTGRPKAAGLTHHNVVNNAVSVTVRGGISEESCTCVNVPLFHCFGNVGGTLQGAVTGGKNVFPAPGWNPKATLNAIKNEKCDLMLGTPTMFVDMFQTVDKEPELKENLKSLETAIVGASLMPAEYVKKANDEFDIQTMVF